MYNIQFNKNILCKLNKKRIKNPKDKQTKRILALHFGTNRKDTKFQNTITSIKVDDTDYEVTTITQDIIDGRAY